MVVVLQLIVVCTWAWILWRSNRRIRVVSEPFRFYYFLLHHVPLLFLPRIVTYLFFKFLTELCR